MPPGSPEPPRREDAPTLSQPPRPEPSDGTLSLPAAPADGTLSLPAQPHDGTLSLPARQDDGTLSQPEPLHAEAPGAAPDWKVGDVIEGRYEVLGLIGRGGMGAVYKVRHLAWSLELAVKTPLPNLVANPAARARFLREAQTWVDLGLHPNIVQCWYVRELGGLPRVFVDFMPSGDLKDLRRSGQIQAGDWPRIVDLAVQAADGLGYAHQKGVVHRDVKPGNMLIAADGRVCVTDFGLVKLANAEDIQGAGGAPAGGDPALTMAGATMGTPQYGAPEQWGRAQSVDARADVYALGIVLYELLAGRRPFDDGVNAEPAHVLIARHLTSAPPDPREFNAAIPEPLASFALRCLAKQPDRRPPEMRAFREELAALYAPLAGRPYPRELPSAAEARADAFNNRAVSFFDLGRPKEAFAAWDEALRLDGRHPEALYNRSILEWRAARVTDLEVEERLRESAQAYPRARLYLGYLNLERFAAEPAEKAIAEALQDEILAQDGGAWRALGHARAAQGRFAEASEAYAQALQRMPGDAGAREGEAWALAQASPLPWRRCAQVLSDLGSSVLALAPLPDGRSILAACGDYAVRQLELPGGRQMLAYTGHAKEVFALAVLPGGRQFVTAGGDSNLKLWNLGRETSLDSFYGKAHAGHVFGLAAAPDGSFLVSAGRDKGVRLWKLPAGDVAKTLRGHEEAVLALALSPDGRLALSADEHGALRLWDTAAGAEAGGFGGNAKPAQTVGFSPDGAHAASGGEDGSLCLWDVAARKLARTFRGHRGTVRAAAFSPDGRRLVSGGDDRTVRVWDTASGRCLATFREHAGPLRALALGADGASVFSGAMESAGQPLRRWDLALGLPPVQEAEAFARLAAPLVVCRVESQVQAQAASRRFREQLAVAEQALKADDPSRAFHSLRRARTVAGYEHDPQALELNSKLARRLPCTGLNSAYRRFQLEAHPRGLAGLALAPDARLAVTCGREEKSVTLWDLAAQRAAWTFEGHARPVNAVAITFDGKRMVSAGDDDVLKVWELAEWGKGLATLEGHTDAVHALALNPDGRLAASGGYDRGVRMWDLNAGTCKRVFEGHAEPVTALAWSPDGRQIASASRDGAIRVWSVVSGKCMQELNEHFGAVTALAFSADGRRLLSGGEDKAVCVWNAEAGKLERTLRGHKGAVRALASTPDGKFMLSGAAEGADAPLRLWALKTGQFVREFAPHAQGVTGLALHADGCTLLSCGEAPALYAWLLDWDLDAGAEPAAPAKADPFGFAPKPMARTSKLMPVPPPPPGSTTRAPVPPPPGGTTRAPVPPPPAPGKTGAKGKKNPFEF